MLLLLILGLLTYGGAQKQLVKITVVVAVINVVINIINSHYNECQNNFHDTQEEESELLEGSESQNYG